MHPTAVLLALRGCRPVKFQGSMAYIRVAHRLERGALALYLEAGKIDTQAEPFHYTEVAWDDITDDVWDRLPPEILAEFLEKL